MMGTDTPCSGLNTVPFCLLSLSEETSSLEIDGSTQIVSVDHLKPVHIPSCDDLLVDCHNNAFFWY